MEKHELTEDEKVESGKFSSKLINLTLIGLTVIVGVITYLSFVDGFKVKQQQEIAAYIESTDSLIQESGIYANKIVSGYELNELPLFSREDEETFHALVNKAASLKAPKHWEEHKVAVEKLVSERHEFFTQYHSGNILWSDQNLVTMQDKEAVLEKEEKEALIEGLERYEIPYEESDNGNIRFSVKSY